MTSEFTPGVYRHYKGHRYLAMFLARDCNNFSAHEPSVVYVSLGEPQVGCLNVRRLAEFSEVVAWPDGQHAPRFRYLGPAPQL